MPAPRKAASLNLRHAELEARIAAAPADDGPRALLGDWLLEQGDLRGELIALGLVARQKPASVGEQLDRLLRTRGRDLLGALSACQQFTFEAPGVQHGEGRSRLHWDRGFIRSAYLDSEDSAAELDPEDAVTLLFANPSGLMLEELRVRDRLAEGVMRALIAAAPARLRELELDAVVHEFEGNATQLVTLDGLWNALPSLESLNLSQIRGAELGTIVHPHLRELLLFDVPLSPKSIAAVLTAKLPRCERLVFSIGGRAVVTKNVSPLLSAKTYPMLHDLSIGQGRFGADLIEGLAASRLLPQLRRLSLDSVDTAGVEIIHRRARAFAHLESFDLSYPGFPETWFKRLGDAGVQARATVTAG